MTLAQGFHFIKRSRILNVIFLEKQDLDIVVHFETENVFTLLWHVLYYVLRIGEQY